MSKGVKAVLYEQISIFDDAGYYKRVFVYPLRIIEETIIILVEETMKKGDKVSVSVTYDPYDAMPYMVRVVSLVDGVRRMDTIRTENPTVSIRDYLHGDDPRSPFASIIPPTIVE